MLVNVLLLEVQGTDLLKELRKFLNLRTHLKLEYTCNTKFFNYIQQL